MEAPIEVLLADSVWLRRLTLQLARDADGAADLEQDVAVAALRAERHPVGRPWLAAVARRLWALRLRRRRREAERLARLEPDESSPGAADVVADAELQRRAVDAVLALPPHYRDTILLRFLRGLSVEATAARLGVGVEAVRTRQKRALRLLRNSLVPRHERRAGLAVPFGGVLVVVNKYSVTAAAAAFVVALCGWLVWRDARTPAPDGATAPLLAAAAADAPDAPQGGVGRPPRTDAWAATEHGTRDVVVDATPVPVQPPTSPPRRAPTVPTGDILVTVVGDDGQPAGEGNVILCRSSDGPGQVLVSDAASLVRFADLPVGRYSLATASIGRRPEHADVTAGGTTLVTMRVWSGSRITGRVVDAAGQPVPFAAIQVRNAGWPSWPFPVGRADAAGAFDVPAAAAMQTVFATDARLGTTAGRLLRAPDLARDPPAPIVLRFAAGPVGQVRGRVVDTSGTPIARAWVQLSPHGAPSDDPAVTLCSTDLEGRFAAAGIPVGRCGLYVHAKGRSPQARQLQVRADEPVDVEVVLAPGAVVRGIVRDALGTPVERAYVQIEGKSYPPAYHVQTDADGRFVFEDVAAGTCRIAAWQKQLSRVRREVPIEGPGEHEIEIVLGGTDADAVRGRLLDARGQPLAHWIVERAASGRWTTTDTAGRFVCVECKAAANELRVRPNRPGTAAPVHAVFPDLRPGPDEQVLVVGEDRMPNATVRGHVVDAAGRAVEGARLELEQFDSSFVLPVRTQADGAFELGPLPPGSYRLQPRHDGHRWAAVPFEVRAWQQLQLPPITASR